jgi:hypothetical protein
MQIVQVESFIANKLHKHSIYCDPFPHFVHPKISSSQIGLQLTVLPSPFSQKVSERILARTSKESYDDKGLHPLFW